VACIAHFLSLPACAAGLIWPGRLPACTADRGYRSRRKSGSAAGQHRLHRGRVGSRDHLSLNGYSRQTTPFLEQLQRQGILYNWKDSAASATASLHSNTLLLTGINQLADVAQDTRRLPTIFAYAKAMGYRVSLLDVQMNTQWLMQPDDYALVDEWLTRAGLFKRS